MDISSYLEPRPAPRALFDELDARRSRVRYMVPTSGGDWRSVTVGAHAEAVRRMALFFSTRISRGDRVAIFANNSVAFMSAALGAQAMGGVMVPIYAASTADQAASVLEHCEARALCVGGEAELSRIFDAWERLPELKRIVLLGPVDVLDLAARRRERGLPTPTAKELEERCLPFERAIALGAARDAEDPCAFPAMLDAVTLDQIGLMLYTSGTSGPPKGVPLSHANVAANGADWLRVNAPLVEEGDTDLLWLPMTHIFGFGEACLGNTLGFTSYLTDAASVIPLLPEVRPQVFMSVPSVWEKIAASALAEEDPEQRIERLEASTGGRLRFCLSGGAGLSREVKSLFHSAGLLLVEGYGLTECSPTLTLNCSDAFRFDSVGKPLPSVSLRLADDGEILARGPNVFAGYHRDAEATAAAFDDEGWFHTGDLGRFTEDGFLQIVGRKKEILVTSGGKNIAPVNIEQRFADDPWIQHVVVYGDGHKYLVAGVFVDPTSTPDPLCPSSLGSETRASSLRALVEPRIARVNAELAHHETIKRFFVSEEPLSVEGGLLTATLKVKRKAVYERYAERFEALYAEPREQVAGPAAS